MSEQKQFDAESIKQRFSSLMESWKKLDPNVKKSIELFESLGPEKKGSDSVDQFIGNLRKWYYGTDPHADERMSKMEEAEKFLFGHVSGNPFREGDLEILNRYIKESREKNNKDKQ